MSGLSYTAWAKCNRRLEVVFCNLLPYFLLLAPDLSGLTAEEEEIPAFSFSFLCAAQLVCQLSQAPCANDGSFSDAGSTVGGVAKGLTLMSRSMRSQQSIIYDIVGVWLATTKMLGRETKVVKALLASDYGVFGVEDLIFFGECCEVPFLVVATWIPEESNWSRKHSVTCKLGSGGIIWCENSGEYFGCLKFGNLKTLMWCLSRKYSWEYFGSRWENFLSRSN